MYRGEDDLRPTPFAEVLGTVAAAIEWASPLVLLFSTDPVLIRSAVCLMVLMHVYIVTLIPVDLHLWNSFTAVAAIYLFLGEQPVGFDWAAWF